MIETLWPYLKYLFGFIGAVAVIEIYLSTTWWPGYFLNGIPIYWRKVLVSPEILRVPSAEQIEKALPDSGWRTPLLVRSIGRTVSAFGKRCNISISVILPSCMAVLLTTDSRAFSGFEGTRIPVPLCLPASSCWRP